MIDLHGEWRFALDNNDSGIDQQWFQSALGDSIRIPGSLQEQGFGNDVTMETEWTGQIVDRSWFSDPKYAPYREEGNIKVPFWLQPEKHYIGVAWYQREFSIPDDWAGRPVVLTMERPHIQSRVWIDGVEKGGSDSLSTPHITDLGVLSSGAPHILTVRIDNRLHIDVGINSHSVSDHTQTNWNGIIGDVTLHARNAVWIENIQVYPHVKKREIEVHARIASTHNAPPATILANCEYGAAAQTSVQWDEVSGNAHLRIALSDYTPLWDEFSPSLLRLDVALEFEGGREEKTFHVGLREVETCGTQICVNGRKTFLRGTLECCVFPHTGYPPTDEAAWERIFKIVQSHGLNHVRFHSWCPPEAAFCVADRLGIYLQIECSSWASVSTSLGEGKPVDAWIYQEAERIIQAFGNHPSFLLMAYGNEPGGKINEYLSEWVCHWKNRDTRRLYTSGAGWPALPENDFQNIADPRIYTWGEGDKARINAAPPETCTDYTDTVARFPQPIVSHEIGQWCVYPNFAEIDKYQGVLKAKNFEIFRDTLTRNGMAHLAHDFLMSSGKLQALCYKEEIESSLRTPGFGGFQLLQANDFSGQGTALVGWRDAFWDEKGYLSAEEFRRFCGPVTPIARLKKRIFENVDTLEATIEVAHYGPADLCDVIAEWALVAEDGTAVLQGKTLATTAPQGTVARLGKISVSLKNVAAPAKYRFVVSIPAANASNDWNVWVYPAAAEIENASSSVVETSDLAVALTALETGKDVLLSLPPDSVQSDVGIEFSTIFWNTAWTGNQVPHTLGIFCKPEHPVFADFPTDSHSDWQWWELVHNAAAMVLNELPTELVSLIQPIDDWFRNRRLALMFEVNVGQGRLLVHSMDFNRLDERPVARQLRSSILKYMNRDDFRPTVELQSSQLEMLLKSP